MIKSMTGFGRYEFVGAERKITVEMKSVNHRYSEISVRMPKKLNMFETGIRNVLKQYISRGKVDMFITYEDESEGKACVRYNEELAREVAASQIPVISAVGHETDFTICDFVADRRAPTPSAAAELAVPDTLELKRKIQNIVTREAGVLQQIAARHREKLLLLAGSRVLQDPTVMIDDKKMQIAMLSERLTRAEERIRMQNRAALQTEAGKLSALNPLAVLSRGYSAVYREDGLLVKSAENVKAGDCITVRTEDGELDASVTAVRLMK